MIFWSILYRRPGVEEGSAVLDTHALLFIEKGCIYSVSLVDHNLKPILYPYTKAIWLSFKERFSYCNQNHCSFFKGILIAKEFLSFMNLIALMDCHLVGLFLMGLDCLIYESITAPTSEFIPMSSWSIFPEYIYGL